MEIGQKQEPTSAGIINHFDENDLLSIVGTMEFFNATDIWIKQTVFDLKSAKYRLFDWLAMCIMSRNDDDRQLNNTALKVLVWSYLKSNGVPKDFIADLRETDYQLDLSYDCIKDIIEF